MSSLHTSCQQLGISLERAEADLLSISHRLTEGVSGAIRGPWGEVSSALRLQGLFCLCRQPSQANDPPGCAAGQPSCTSAANQTATEVRMSLLSWVLNVLQVGISNV